jgi:hypothetical protein
MCKGSNPSTQEVYQRKNPTNQEQEKSEQKFV